MNLSVEQNADGESEFVFRFNRRELRDLDAVTANAAVRYGIFGRFVHDLRRRLGLALNDTRHSAAIGNRKSEIGNPPPLVAVGQGDYARHWTGRELIGGDPRQAVTEATEHPALVNQH